MNASPIQASTSQPLGALPENDTPIKPRVKRTRVVHLTTDQLLAHAPEAEKIGRRAAARHIKGRETRALSILLGELSKWAHDVEPRLSLAQFVVDAQRAAKNLNLRRELGYRRTAAFRRALAESQRGSNAPPLDDVVEDVGERLSPSRVAEQLDMDIDPTDVVHTEGMSSVARSLDMNSSHVQTGTRPRVAEALDMGIDPDDVMERVEKTTGFSEGKGNGIYVDAAAEVEAGTTIPVVAQGIRKFCDAPAPSSAIEKAVAAAEDDDDEYDLDILREFEEGA